jgi:hypothetical protein
MKRFRCIPVAIMLPIFFFAGATIHAALLAWVISDDMDIVGIAYTGFMFIMCTVFTLALLSPTGYSVTIHPNHIVCKSLTPKSKFSMQYDDCSIGMDFHTQSGIKVWWIYLCKGSLHAHKKGKQINSVKIQPGFIRIMYSDEVYQALIEVLPKKQQTALATARRYAGIQEF